jgi:hypothetical protein
MKIIKARADMHQQYPFQLKFFKKGMFWVLLEEEAFFASKHFSLKLTPHDKHHIKIGFPVSAENNRFWKFENAWLWYVLIENIQKIADKTRQVTKSVPWKYFNILYQINLEDYQLTKERILWLSSLNLEEKQQKNFLLKDKIEEMYLIISQRLIKMPKIERRYFREKIEKMMMNMLALIYEFMYSTQTRKESIDQIMQQSLIVREFTRFLYKLGKIKNDNVYLDTAGKREEILKITKTLQNKYASITE